MAGKPRVHEIAAELGIDSKRTLEKLKEIGEFVKGPSSTVEPPVARKLKAAFAEEGVVPVPKEEKPAPAAKPAAAPAPAPEASAPVDTPAPSADQPASPEAPSAKPSATGIPRPGNNPFASSQGMAKPGIPRPGNNPFASSQGMGRPAPPRPGQGATPRRSDERPGGTRPPFQQRSGGSGRPGGPGGAPGGGPGGARPGGGRPGAGGRGRGPGGGTAGAFGRGGSKSKSRKSKRTKRQEYEMREAPSIGGVSIPRGDGTTAIRLRQGASMADFADKIEMLTGVHVPPGNLVTVLFQLGEMATATESLDAATFEVLGSELGYKVEIVSPEDEDKELLESFDIDLDEEEDEDDLVIRPPVVTVMGHVDHGKTKLLDAIRSANVVAGEAGGITQHIGAYQVWTEHEGIERAITFVDTPGHEAFTAMRARGAQVTDIAVLVVAADDGIMPQTIEALNHAQAAGVPIVVAINKIDTPGAKPDKILQQLTEFGMVAEEYGGDVQAVRVSALKGEGITELLDAILLTADAGLDLRANPNRTARGVAIEAKLDKGRGAVATVLIQSGTLRVGEAIVAGTAYGRVRAMMDENGEPVEEAYPARPVAVQGLSSVPKAGDTFLVTDDDRTARQIAESVKRQSATRCWPKLASASAWKSSPRLLRMAKSKHLTSSSRVMFPVLWKPLKKRCSRSRWMTVCSCASFTAVWVPSPKVMSTLPRLITPSSLDSTSAPMPKHGSVPNAKASMSASTRSFTTLSMKSKARLRECSSQNSKKSSLVLPKSAKSSAPLRPEPSRVVLSARAPLPVTLRPESFVMVSSSLTAWLLIPCVASRMMSPRSRPTLNAVSV